jgi:uncharacterized membrane protein
LLDGGSLRDFFAAVCHQIAERSIGADGALMPLCARCAGLYDGLFIVGAWYASLRALGWKPRFSRFTLAWVTITAVLCVVDGVSGASHALGASNLVRFALGLGAGIAIGGLLTHHFTTHWQDQRTVIWLPAGESLGAAFVLGALGAASASTPLGLAALSLAAAIGLLLLHATGFGTAVTVALRTWNDPGWLMRRLPRRGQVAAVLALIVVTPARAGQQAETIEACVSRKSETARAALREAIASGSSLRVLNALRGTSRGEYELRGECERERSDPDSFNLSPDVAATPGFSPTITPTPTPREWEAVRDACILRMAREVIDGTGGAYTRGAQETESACRVDLTRGSDDPVIFVNFTSGRGVTSVTVTPTIRRCIIDEAGKTSLSEQATAIAQQRGVRLVEHAAGLPPQDQFLSHLRNVQSVCALAGGSLADWRPPRSPLIHPYLPPVFIGLVIGGAFWFRKKRLEVWNEEKEKLRSALLTELKLPKNGDAAARKSVLALLTATRDVPGGEELWLAFVSDRIIAIHKDGRRTSVPVKNLRKLDLVEFGGADFGIAIDTTSGKTDIDGRLRFSGASDMVRVVNILIRQGVSVGYRKA